MTRLGVGADARQVLDGRLVRIGLSVVKAATDPVTIEWIEAALRG